MPDDATIVTETETVLVEGLAPQVVVQEVENVVVVQENPNVVVVSPERELIVVGVPGPAGPATPFFEFEQSTPATTWTITHPLNKYPSVMVVDSARTVVVGSVTYQSKSVIVLNFNVPFGGWCYLT